MSNPGNVIGGHKANLHNPNTSEESKEHSREVLQAELGTSPKAQATSAGPTAHTDDGKNPDNVARGLKAAIHNPNVSDEAKEHAQERLDDIEGNTHTDESKNLTSDGKNPDNVARGLKAAIHNPNVSDEAKEHAQERLEHMK